MASEYGKQASKQAQQAGIGAPEIAIYNAAEINAFAAGLPKQCPGCFEYRLLERLGRDEAKVVLGHEIRHIANSDMVTMTLIQGILNAFVFFFAHIAASAISRGKNNRFLLCDCDGLSSTVRFIGKYHCHVVLKVAQIQSRCRRRFSSRKIKNDLCITEIAKCRPGEFTRRQPSAFGISGKGAKREFFMSHPPL